MQRTLQPCIRQKVKQRDRRYRSARIERTGLKGLFQYRTAGACASPESSIDHGLAPGLRRTDLNAAAAASGGDPAEAAAGAVRLALLPDDGPAGEFFSWDGTPVPW
jgi:hypothetical protein